jgi:AcrR family transcriptional regulator
VQVLKAASKKSANRRNRADTEKAIVAAFEKMLRRDGVSSIGINSLAQETGVGKTLIYRYFDSLAGVASRWASESNLWPTDLELIGNDIEAFEKLPIEERICMVLCNFVREVRKRPLVIEVLGAELLSPTDVTRALEAAVSYPGAGVDKYIRPGPDDAVVKDTTPRLIMTVNSLVAYLCIRERNNPEYLGFDMTKDANWDYVIETITLMTRKMLAR